jgi:very-short-patch-repair endonuclease
MGIKIDLNKFDWDLINSEHIKGMYWKNIPSKFGFSKTLLQRAEKEGFIKKIKHIKKHTDKCKQNLSIKMSEYLKKNPDKCVWKRSDKLKSVPCENLKKKLKDNNINFVEEFKPINNRFFSIDIAFPDKKIGIEVNGTQHYDKNGGLKEYYQKRKEEIEKLGWKLFDIHYSKVYKECFVKDLIYRLKEEYDLKDIDYSFYIKEPKKKIKIKSRKEYLENLSNINFKNIHSKRIKLIKSSNIIFNKMGWVNKVSKLIGITPQNINRWMKKYMYDFYEKECFKKVDRFGLSKFKKYGSTENYLKYRNEISFKSTDERINIMKKYNISLFDKGWCKKLINLFKIKKTSVYKWVNKNRIYILSKY